MPKIIAFFLTLFMFSLNYTTFAMVERIKRYEVWPTPQKELVEIIWTKQVVHQLTSTDREGNPVVRTSCLFPNNKTERVSFSIVKGCFDKNNQSCWLETQKHVKESIAHIQMRGYNTVNMTKYTWHKMKQLELETRYNFSYSDLHPYILMHLNIHTKPDKTPENTRGREKQRTPSE